jgi:hypothetical protein
VLKKNLHLNAIRKTWGFTRLTVLKTDRSGIESRIPHMVDEYSNYFTNRLVQFFEYIKLNRTFLFFT